MNEPRVSVLMPVFNAQRYVAQAVESILAQTLADFEFLIIDDGSTDRSLQILERYAAMDPRICLTSRANAGYLTALNEGLHRARSELVARMDADDVSRPDRLARQADYLASHPDCLAVGSAVELIDPDGRVLCRETPLLMHREIDQSLLQGLAGLTHPAAMIRRRAMLEVGGYRPECYGAEDKDLWMRLAEHGLLANLPEALLQYRVHEGNFTFAHYERGLAALERAIVDAHARRGLAPPDDPLAAVPPAVSAWERRRLWAWSAVGAGQYSAARQHAWAVWRSRIWSRKSWVLLAHAILGRKAGTLRRAYLRLARRAP